MNVIIENLPGGRFYTTGDGIVSVHKSYRKSFGYGIKHKCKRNGNPIYAIACKADVRERLKEFYPKQQNLELDMNHKYIDLV